MIQKKTIIGICGSASRNSANLSILKLIANLENFNFNLETIDDLAELPHFRTENTIKNVPDKIIELQNTIANADGIIICTPEYIFSIPSGLKNMIEWCVSTTVFTDKPIGLITASSSGVRGHQELKLIMETVQTNFTNETTLLIQEIKGKIDKEGKISDEKTINQLKEFIRAFNDLTESSTGKTDYKE